MLTLKGEVCIKSNIFSRFPVFRQFSEDKESPVSTTPLAKAHTLHTNGQRIQKAASNTTRAYSTDGMYPPIAQKNE